jgi:hypothetical protein
MKKAISFVLVLSLSLTAKVTKADFVFGKPTKVPNINSSYRDLKPSVSADGLSLFFTSTRPGGVGGMDIWVTTRQTTNNPWGEPVNLGSPVNSSAWETGCISYDGLSFYFSSTRNRGSNANADIWVTIRDTIHSEWGTPMNLGPTVNSSADQCYISITIDELSFYFSSNRSGGYGAYDIWVTTRETIDDDWSTPVNLGPTVNSSGYDTDPSISADGRVLFFQSTRPGGLGGECDIWMTRRATKDDSWGEPVNLGPTINGSAAEDCPYVSADGSSLFFRYSQSGRHSGGDIWQAPIIPIVDFNADGVVDAADTSIMIDHWGEDYSFCDIGPTPLGDSVVDTQDLIALSEYFFEDINDPTLIAHWALDETEGIVVPDSVGDNNGYAIGDPVWLPDGGLVDGALQLDGIDDYVVTGTPPNPADGQLSVLAWINGGAPGQVVFSQQGTANWLMADTEGNLMTELKGTDRSASPLQSQTIITDGHWHRIGFVWDGTNRILYVDDAAVAIDTQQDLADSDSGLYIGCGKGMEAGTFWSGLIDDVRIYNRAVCP